MPKNPVYHRELFQNLLPKSEYTIQDLWIYFNIKLRNDNSWTPNRIRKSEYEKRVKDFVDGIGQVPPDTKESLLSYVSFYGLEPVLVSIDLIADAIDGTAGVRDIPKFISRAVVMIGKMEIVNKVV